MYKDIFNSATEKLLAPLLWMYLEESKLLAFPSFLSSCLSLLIFPRANLSREPTFLSPPWIAAFACEDKQVGK